jgi:hypothetical protein
MFLSSTVIQGTKRQWSEADHSSPCSAEVKKGGAIHSLLHMSSWHSAYLIKHIYLTFFFFYYYLHGLGPLACAHSELINESYRLSVGLLGRVISRSQGRYLHRINADIVPRVGFELNVKQYI